MQVGINHVSNYDSSVKRIDLEELDKILKHVNEYLIATFHGYEMHHGEEIKVTVTVKL